MLQLPNDKKPIDVKKAVQKGAVGLGILSLPFLFTVYDKVDTRVRANEIKIERTVTLQQEIRSDLQEIKDGVSEIREILYERD